MKILIEILTGAISGIVTAMGMGGGTILILILSVFLGFDQRIAQATNLVFFVPTSITAIIINIRRKIINWKTGIIVVISGIIGAIVGANIAVNLDVKNLKKLFGLFLMAIAIYQIYEFVKEYKFSRKSNNKNI